MTDHSLTPLCALYARSSIEDPTGHLQLEELWEFIQLRGWKAVHEYVDLGLSGTTYPQPALDTLMKDASEHRFDCVLVGKIDRLAYSVQLFLERLKHLESLGVRLVAPFQSIDTDDVTLAGGDLLLNIARACAEFDSVKELSL